jgi:predicted amidohydrolase
MVKRGVRIGISICNDTFYEAWEPHFRDVDVWIDIKANNADFTDETRALFRRALPARISGAEGTIGITVCLGGTFLDLFWEGPSSIIEGASTGYRVLRRASSPELPEILIADLGL